MRTIKGHKSWNISEIMEILRKTGCFTACTLPHYRYLDVKRRCGVLQKKGLIEVSGRSDTSIFFRVTDKFRAQQQGEAS